MTTTKAQRTLLAALAVGGAFTVAPAALAVNPLEYPDNGAASFSRGGAWLATGNEPIATHYNPAALATQGSGFSIDQNLAFDHVCYDRRGPPTPTNPAGEAEKTAEGLQYQPACSRRAGFPSAVPSIAIVWRATDKLGIGVAIVPPSTYVIADNTYSATTPGLNTGTNPPTYQQVPAPWRYQLLQQRSTILFPTLGVGYEIARNFRIGAAFISGIATINTTVAGVATEDIPAPGQVRLDAVQNDGFTTLKTKDLFMPGAILALHWSPATVIDVAAWGRYISPVESSKGDLTLTKNAYDPNTGFSTPTPICRQGTTVCGSNPNVGINYQYHNETFRKFKLPIPPEIRVGVRYHQPRTAAPNAPKVALGDAMPKRDPLHDDVFDVELDGSYTFNTTANTIEIRFADNGAGQGTSSAPPGYVPPNADRWNGFKNSFGVRLGGQYNVLPDKLGIRAGTWIETQAQDPQWLQVSYVAALRGGFGGGVVFRQNFIDISIGFQHQWSAGLDNHGEGLMRGTTTAGKGVATPTNPSAEPNVNEEPPGVTAATRQQYRTYHTINDGRITQSANVFTLGGTVHF